MKILLAEDEKDLSRALVAVLNAQGYETTPVYNGQEAVDHATKESFDCFVFDVMMPEKDGVTALKEIRATGDNTPAIFLTAKSETDDKITGLDAGADDYLTKPFVMAELMARIRSLVRRSGSFTPTNLQVGSLMLNTSEQELKSTNAVRLAGKETKLMEYFMLNPGKELSTETIHSHVWKDEDVSADVVYIYISYLRDKLKAISADTEILGEKNGSYRLVTANETEPASSITSQNSIDKQ